IPATLQNAMSKQAQAERERQARIILGTAETEIAAKFVEAAGPYQSNPVAVHLRAMNMLYEGLKEKGSIVVVPSSAVESMNLGALGGLASLGGNGAAPRLAEPPAAARAPSAGGRALPPRPRFGGEGPGVRGRPSSSPRPRRDKWPACPRRQGQAGRLSLRPPGEGVVSWCHRQRGPLRRTHVHPGAQARS